MTKPCGIILAGGQARRMGGGDKGLLSLGGKSLLQRGIDTLRPQVGNLAINANGDPHRFKDYNVPIIPDTFTDDAGPLAGILAGLNWAATKGDAFIVTAAVDTPFFPSDLARKLWDTAQCDDAPIVVAATYEDGKIRRHPTFGIWSVALRDDLNKALHAGVRKIVSWADTHGARQTVFDTGQFFNINTPQDLTQAKAML